MSEPRVLARDYRKRLDAIYSGLGHLGDLLNHGELQEIGAEIDGLSTLSDVRGKDPLNDGYVLVQGDWLRKYGNHLRECSIYSMNFCDCGFETALSESEAAQP